MDKGGDAHDEGPTLPFATGGWTGAQLLPSDEGREGGSWADDAVWLPGCMRASAAANCACRFCASATVIDPPIAPKAEAMCRYAEFAVTILGPLRAPAFYAMCYRKNTQSKAAVRCAVISSPTRYKVPIGSHGSQLSSQVKPHSRAYRARGLKGK